MAESRAKWIWREIRRLSSLQKGCSSSKGQPTLSHARQPFSRDPRLNQASDVFSGVTFSSHLSLGHSDMLRYLINVKFLQRTSLGLGLELSVEYILIVSSIQHQKLKQKPKVLNIGDYAARLDSKWRSSCLCYPNTGITDVHHHSQPKADPHAPASFPLPTLPFSPICGFCQI